MLSQYSISCDNILDATRGRSESTCESKPTQKARRSLCRGHSDIKPLHRTSDGIKQKHCMDPIIQLSRITDARAWEGMERGDCTFLWGQEVGKG